MFSVKKVFESIKKFSSRFKKQIVITVSVILSFLVLHTAFIMYYGFCDSLSTCDVAVVLGNQVLPDGTPSRTLKSRLDAALSVYEKNLVKLIVVSGGIDMNGFHESQVMKEYLVEKSIPEKLIVCDDTGINTRATARFMGKFLKERNLSSVMIITSYSHILRTMLSMKFEGIKDVSHFHGKYFFEIRNFHSVFREIIGFYYYLLKEPFIHKK